MKGDRFTKIVARERYTFVYDGERLIRGKDAVKLLRREHAAVVRTVEQKRKATVSQFPHSQICMGYREACCDILAELYKRAKGGTKCAK